MLSNLTNKYFAITLFKALSVYLFIRAIEYFVYNLPFLFGTENHSALVIIQVIAQPMLFLICGFALWCSAPLLASFNGNSSGSDVKAEMSSKNIQIIVFSAIGIFILFNSIPEIIQAAVYYSIGSFALDKQTMTSRNSLVISLIIKIALGLWLLFGSRGIVKIIRSVRRD